MRWSCFLCIPFFLASILFSVYALRGGSPAAVTVLESPFISSHILLVSTLDGLLHAVDRQEGNILWTVKEPPRLQVSSSQIGDKVFVTDPKDGGLYVIDADRNIQKFPKTIPELVGESPQRTADGILITGKKTATWMAIDPRSGLRYDYQPEALSTCPIPSESAVFIPRTEYVLSLLDSTRQHVWNVTYTQYGASPNGASEASPDVILSASNSGELLKLTADRQSVSWYQKYNSPVVGIYLLHSDGSLRQVSHHVVVPQVMKKFINEAESSKSIKQIVPELLKNQSPAKNSKNSLDRMLFVGQHGASAYCMPTLLDRKTPKGEKMQPFFESVMEAMRDVSQDRIQDRMLLSSNDSPLSVINDSVDLDNNINVTDVVVTVKKEPICIATVLDDKTVLRPTCLSEEPVEPADSNVISPAYRGYYPYPYFSGETINKEILNGVPLALPAADPVEVLVPLISPLTRVIIIIITSLSLGLFAGIFFMWKKRTGIELEGSRGSLGSTGSRSSHQQHSHTGDNIFVIGKIHFDSTQLLGRGCDGTLVYKGKFDGRDVAVKRLLPDCFSFADREVALLKESDFHTNVIRYFATESDSQFRYIALELCQATLLDFVEHRLTKFSDLEVKPILTQAMTGLSHLHKLNIVHRDIKPHNILLSYPTSHGDIRVLISDFGLCKKLSQERMSFSKVTSGVLGTQGWIAPEMLDGNAQKASRSVDIFSMGCVIYYCLTDGHHPFGDNGFSRQANIVDGKFQLDLLKEEEQEGLLAKHLVTQMLQAQPAKRPGADCVLLHPFFWDHARQLAFLQDVSDRIEKEDSSSAIVNQLEKHAGRVVGWNWRQHIGTELQDDLRKFRSYRGGSVRDLLRAIRNKKHHYRELSDEVREALGVIPKGFVHYFTSRFPRLILHTYLAMQCCAEDGQLMPYYSQKYSWANVESPVDMPWRKKTVSDGEPATGSPADSPRESPRRELHKPA